MDTDEQQNLVELEREFHRVGITWQAFAELDRLNDPRGPAPRDDSFAMSLDYAATTTFLRTLPDGAGQAAFIAAWRKRVEPLRRKAEAAMRAEERKRRGDSSSGGPAA